MSVFDYEYKRSPDGIPNGFRYYGVGDATYIFGDEIRCHDFFRFLNSELKAYGKLYVNEQVEFLPVCYYKSDKTQGEFISIDYMFFVQCTARFLVKLGDPKGAEMFVNDFKLGSKNHKQNDNTLALFHYFFQQNLELVYINKTYTKMLLSYLAIYTPTVYKNARTSVEFAALNFKVKELELDLKDANLMRELLGGAKYINATQVAYGKLACDKWWEKEKKTRKYLFTSENFSY